jgi:hypothetical protein
VAAAAAALVTSSWSTKAARSVWHTTCCHKLLSQCARSHSSTWLVNAVNVNVPMKGGLTRSRSRGTASARG